MVSARAICLVAGLGGVVLAGCGRIDFVPPFGPAFAPTHLLAPVDPGGEVLSLGDATIDTTALTIDGAPPPASAAFVVAPQADGTEVAVLVVGGLEVEAGATVRAIGARPLVVVSRGEIVLDGVLDVGAHGVTPGPGGAPPGMGAGAGASAVHIVDVCDPGGGGGGFGGAGAAGGRTQCDATPAPRGGVASGDVSLALLVGGAGGGRGAPGVCAAGARGGAGGGAVQLTSFTAIRGAGQILAGGGGGRGGIACPGDGGGGGGGGAGGAIYLEAPVVALVVAPATGGGGGGGSNGDPGNGAVGDGAAGADGGAGGAGGAAIATIGTDGGHGGGAADPVTPPDAVMNGGGGGGGRGLTVIAPRP
jgi:hypothetical protein